MTKLEDSPDDEMTACVEQYRALVEHYSAPLDWTNDRQLKYYAEYNSDKHGFDFPCALRKKPAIIAYADQPSALKLAINEIGTENMIRYVTLQEHWNKICT